MNTQRARRRIRHWRAFALRIIVAVLSAVVAVGTALALFDRYPLVAYTIVMLAGPSIGIMIAAAVLALHGRRIIE